METERLVGRFRRRRYGALVLEQHRRLDDDALSAETVCLLDTIRPQVRSHADEIYNMFLGVSRSRMDFFEPPTGQQLDLIKFAVKKFYNAKCDMLVRDDEAVAMSRIVTINYARMCGLNQSFRQHILNSGGRGFFWRLVG